MLASVLNEEKKKKVIFVITQIVPSGEYHQTAKRRNLDIKNKGEKIRFFDQISINAATAE